MVDTTHGGGVEWSPRRRAVLCCGLLAGIVLAGVPDRSLAERQFMVQHAELGKWIFDRYGPRRRLAGQPPEMRLVGYYAQTLPVRDADHYSYAAQDLAETIRACRPDVLLLLGQPSDAASWRRLSESARRVEHAFHPATAVAAKLPKRRGAGGRSEQ